MNRILIIDEDKSIQQWYADELTAEGYDVFTAGNDSTAMNLMKQEKPDLVVMDVQMEGCDASDLLRNIRYACSHMPVILSTAYPNFNTGSAKDVWGCRLVRGCDLEELKSQVRKAFCRWMTPSDENVLSNGPKPASVQ